MSSLKLLATGAIEEFLMKTVFVIQTLTQTVCMLLVRQPVMKMQLSLYLPVSYKCIDRRNMKQTQTVFGNPEFLVVPEPFLRQSLSTYRINFRMWQIMSEIRQLSSIEQF